VVSLLNPWGTEYQCIEVISFAADRARGGTGAAEDLNSGRIR
jgi:hypothetical protein